MSTTSLAVAEASAAAPARRRPSLLRRMRRYPLPTLGALLLVVLVTSALAAPWIATHDPFEMNVVDRLQSPNAEYWFGTDAFGRDMFSRTLHGGRVSLIIGIAVAAASTIIGLVIGVIAGYFRLADAILMRMVCSPTTCVSTGGGCTVDGDCCGTNCCRANAAGVRQCTSDCGTACTLGQLGDYCAADSECCNSPPVICDPSVEFRRCILP